MITNTQTIGDKITNNPSNSKLPNSAFISDGCFKKGDYYKGRKIEKIYTTILHINTLGVITWFIHGSASPHKTKWANGEVKEIHDYHFCSTAYYPDILFENWGHNLHKTLQYRIAEDCGFKSPKAMADFLIEHYKYGFKGQIISFKADIEY